MLIYGCIRIYTVSYTLPHLSHIKCILFNNILADAADSKSADLRVLGVQLPLPAPQIPNKLPSILGKAEMRHF
jgi:hypothetical protein